MPKKRNLTTAALGLGIAALVLSATALALNLTAPTTSAPTPVTREVRIVIAALEPHNESMATMEEMHVYLPSTIVVNRGDTIVLTVVNMDEHRHGFEIHGMDVASDNTIDIAGNGGEWKKTFVADRAGVFEWECNVPYVPPSPPSEQDCGEDHDEMKGYLIVQ